RCRPVADRHALDRGRLHRTASARDPARCDPRAHPPRELPRSRGRPLVFGMQLLFVCTGNTCRSPMAEAIARAAVADRQVDVQVGSAGTSAWEGAPASDGALLVALEQGLALEGHRARTLSRELVADADLVLTM